MTGSGTSAQIGFKIETTPGTRIVPTRFLELVSENITVDRQTIRSQGIRTGRRTASRMSNGASLITGQFTVIAAPQGLGMLLQAVLGAVSTSGAGPYTHVFTPGSITDDTLTVQVGRPRVLSTTVDPTDYLGVSLNGFSMSASATDTEEIPVVFDIAGGMGYSTAQTLASASFPSGYSGFRWLDSSISVGGSDVAVKTWGVDVKNNLVGNRLRISATTPGTPKQSTEGGLRTATGTLTADYSATTLRDAYFSGADLAVSLALASGTTSLTIAGNVRPTGSTGVVAGPDNLEQPFAYEFYSSTSDAAAITVTLVNSDSTP